MTDTTDIVHILKNSEAYKSLRDEKTVASQLKKIGWKVVQSPYYLDDKTKKLREIDVIASKRWRKKTSGKDLTATVKIFVEVKSNSGFHILLSGMTNNSYSFGSNEHWMGYDNKSQDRIENMLSRFQMDNEDVLNFTHHIEKIAFPDYTMQTSELRLKPPQEKECFSAFRETNGKKEKDLDNSVLWRAALALQSSVTSSKEETNKSLVIDLKTDLEVARRDNEDFTSNTSTIESHACSIDFYLPIVVSQSRIWSSEAHEPRELKWARINQLDVYGDADNWFELVNILYLEEYLELRTKYFENEFENRETVPF